MYITYTYVFVRHTAIIYFELIIGELINYSEIPMWIVCHPLGHVSTITGHQFLVAFICRVLNNTKLVYCLFCVSLICVYIYMHISIHIYTYIHIYIYIYIYIHTYCRPSLPPRRWARPRARGASRRPRSCELLHVCVCSFCMFVYTSLSLYIYIYTHMMFE